MTDHRISIHAQETTVTASTLAGLLQQTGIKIMQFSEGLDINHRTAQRRMKEPETLTVKELLALAALLKVSEQQLLNLISDEYRGRPVQEPAAPAEENASAKNTPAKKVATRKPGKP